MEEDRVVGTENFRPDHIVQKGNDILILDITVPFRNALVALEEARKTKLEKNNNLATELSINSKKAIVEAIVVGGIGVLGPGK